MPTPELAPREAIARLRAASLYRSRRVVEPGATLPLARVGGRELVVFCSNDYLGLAADPRVTAALVRAASVWGTGAGAAHLVTGHTREHHALEESLADFTGRERALLFSTGYMANLGVVSALAGRGDLVAEDRRNHASLIDAARLSGARVRRYTHGDARAAGRRLGSGPQGRRLLVTDGVFSMDGDLAPLNALAAEAGRYGAWLMVDDAHGLGVLGPEGRGSVAAAGLDAGEVPVLVGTFGKALGTFGAFVAGSADLVEMLVQKARTWIYTTAPPPALAAATRAALEIAREEGWRRRHLEALIVRFRAGAAALGLPLSPSPSPIQPVVLGHPRRALALADGLAERGYWVGAIRPPTVPAGSARLRVTLSAAHSPEQVDGLLVALAECLERLP